MITTMTDGFIIKRMCAILLGVLFFQGLGQAEPFKDDLIHEVTQIRVHVTGANGQDHALESLARNLIVLKEGMPFHVEQLSETMVALKRSGLFQDIRVPDPDFSQPGLVFDFYLKSFQRIRDVRIHNAFPLMEKKVKNALKLYAGDSFTPKPLRDKEERVKAIYRKAGYLDPGVTITADEPVPGEGVLVSVWIDKGDYYRIERVDVQGNESFAGIRLKLRIDSYKASLLVGDGQRFIQEKLDQDIKNLTRFYRDRGYADVKITPRVETLEKEKVVRIHIDIEEGARYVIRFEGNRQFWDLTLRKDIDLVRRGNSGDMALNRGMRSIRERYRKAGYPDAYVSMNSDVRVKRGRPERWVTFTVDEGYRSRVRRLDIQGNASISDRNLKKQVLTRENGLFNDGAYVPETLSDDLSAMKTLYKKNGFQTPEMKPELTWEKDPNRNTWANVTVRVDEGVKTLVSSVRFSGLTVLSESEARSLLGLGEGRAFSENRLEDDEKRLSAAVSERGYPRVTVTGKAEFHNDGQGADVRFDVVEGSYMAMGKVILMGNFRTRSQIIDREMELGEGDPFSLVKFLESQRNIRNINALSGANFKGFGLVEQYDRVDLVVEAEEKKPYYIQTALGYDTRRHGYVNTRLGDRNLLGLNKDTWIAVEYSEIGYRAESGVTEPRFLGTRISSTLNVFSEKLEELNKDFGTRTHGTSLNLSRDFFTYFNTSLAFRYEYRDQYQRDSDVVPLEEIVFYEGRRMVVTSPSISYNSTDSFIRPRKGAYTSLAMDYSKALGDAPDEFIKYYFQARYYYSPLSFLTLAVRCRYGYLQPSGGTLRIPDDQLFFLGGTADVRGYDENMLRYDLAGDSLGGRELAMGGFEVRTDLGRNVELTTFFDTGRIRKTYLDQGVGHFRSSVGAGLRYITPIGPVGFLYGVKISPEKNEPKGQYHFTIGYSF